MAITKWFWSFFANEHQDFDGSGHTVHCSQLSVLLLLFFFFNENCDLWVFVRYDREMGGDVSVSVCA